MIGQTRRRDELSGGASLSAVAPTSGMGASGVTFAAEMARSSGAPPSTASGVDLWQKTMELAQAGGGAARITLNLGSGEPVELRVMVRHGQVSVLAQVGDRAAEAAIQGARETIAQALREAGLNLQRFHVHRTRDAGRSAAGGSRRSSGGERRRRAGEERHR